MKDTIRLSALTIAIVITIGAALHKSAAPAAPVPEPDPVEISWIEFCKARGYDVDDHTEEVENEFLDTWVGSVEEEQAFNNLAAQ